MDDIKIIAAFCIIEEVMLKLDHKSHHHALVSDSEVLTVAVVSAMYFHNNHERALFVMKGMRYITKPLSVSRFSRRLHALAQWLEYILEVVGQVFLEAEAYIIDSMPIPVCKRVRAYRCRKVNGHKSRAYFAGCKAKAWKFYGWRLHLICTNQGMPVRFQMLPGAWHDLTPIHELTFGLPVGAKIYADKGYVSARIKAFLKQVKQGRTQLIATHKKNMKPNTFEEQCGLREHRKRIETVNSQLEKMGIQCLHASTNLGFSIKVMASLLALACINLY